MSTLEELGFWAEFGHCTQGKAFMRIQVQYVVREIRSLECAVGSGGSRFARMCSSFWQIAKPA